MVAKAEMLAALTLVRDSVHDNERGGTTINVYQPCVLNDMSHGNKDQNIYEQDGGIVQQKDSKK